MTHNRRYLHLSPVFSSVGPKLGLGGRLGRLEGGALGNELRPWSSCATLMEPSAGDDELFIAALKRRLRGAGGPEPNDQYVRLAVSLARDPSLIPTTVCKAAVPPVTSSGTRQRILGYRDQIHRDGLLGVCSSQPAQPVDPAKAALRVSPEDQCRVKRAKQRRAQRAHWTELRALINELVDQIVVAHTPVITTTLGLAHSASPPQPALPSPPHPQPAVPSHHISSSTTQRFCFSGVGQYGYANDGQLHIVPPPTSLRCRRGSAANKRPSFYANGTQWSSGFWHVPPGLDMRAYEHQLEEVLGELHDLRDEECMLRGKIIAASAIEAAIKQYEASASPHTRSQDQLKRDLGLAFSLEARVLDYLRVIDEHAEEARRMRDYWYDPRDSDDEYDWADDLSPMNSERAWSPMDYHEL